ncbi:VgrG protein [Cronobacter dublinensis 582]|nr:VgrG protein [Cronobacter dublinensis 582]
MFNQRLTPLNEMIHVHGPQGVAFTSGEHMQLAAAKNVSVSAAGDISFGAMGNMTMLAGEKIGLFARTGPLSLQAGEGPVEMQAQNGGMSLCAQKKLTLTSTSDISFAGKKRITLIGGGSYLTLEEGKIEYGTVQDYLCRVPRTYLGAATSIPVDLPSYGNVEKMPVSFNTFLFS